MSITIIIPTYKRPDSLRQALQSLQEQTLTDFEILVIDNAADVEVETLIKTFNHSAIHQVKYIPEPNLGLHNARHTAAKLASRDVLVFTDDDATFEKNWLQSYLESFQHHPNMVAAGGPVKPKWDVNPPQWLLDYLGKYMDRYDNFTLLSLMDLPNKFSLSHQGYFFGVNMAIRKDVLFEVGGFNPDSFGDIWLGDGESGLNRKLWERNELIGYIPNALVYHHIPQSRMTLNYFCHRMANEGASDMYSIYHRGIPNKLFLILNMINIAIRNLFWLPLVLFQGQTSVFGIDYQTKVARSRSQVKYIFRLLYDTDFRKMVLKEDWLIK